MAEPAVNRFENKDNLRIGFLLRLVPPIVVVPPVVQGIPQPKIVVVLDLLEGQVGTDLGMRQTGALQYSLVLHDDHALLEEPIDGL